MKLATAYIWNEKELLYEKLNNDEYRFYLSEILVNILEEEKLKIYKTTKLHDEDDYDDEEEDIINVK